MRSSWNSAIVTPCSSTLIPVGSTVASPGSVSSPVCVIETHHSMHA
jgi:hypothetical protein